MLAHSSEEMPFAQAYMVITWNLMCGSGNAFGIRYSHMEPRGGALQVYFAHMKTTKAKIDLATLGTSTPILCSQVYVR
ncbi:hypothetical protein P3T76_006942 [Phytophthora citrophthora]|uniref:Uncharacterized protein n=1 Tax=Phytophthora citrophthora TaxID=4793 RepID=A0AAD9GPC3_9STRA|nr:hypothetical protein P3T76_006942 [Phytophthora citrophthora]